MCGVLDAVQLQHLSEHTVRTVHKPGEELLGDARDITSYATVIRGVVKLVKILEDGRQQIVGLQFAPDLVGRLFSRESQLSAEAATELEVCRVPCGVLERMIAENPALEHRLMEQSLRELDEARNWMVTLGRKTASEKVASFLYLISRHHDPEQSRAGVASTQFTLPLTRSDIADFLGLTLETVSRQISKLRLDGVIELASSRDVRVPDLERLSKRCG